MCFMYKTTVSDTGIAEVTQRSPSFDLGTLEDDRRKHSKGSRQESEMGIIDRLFRILTPKKYRGQAEELKELTESARLEKADLDRTIRLNGSGAWKLSPETFMQPKAENENDG